jgi:NAD(P)-dependent dehydrogenase (short-subunit alcohol dehydrogenase family)
VDSLPLTKRVGIVTGGSRGIGGAISSLLAQDGATVAVLGLPEDKERTTALASQLNGAASRLHFYETNVGIFERCKEAVQAVLSEHGRVDFLVNNAGITRDHTIRKMTVEEWEAVLQVNLSGPFFMIKAVLEAMVAQSYGRIVNVSSVVGVTGNFGQANYAAAKAGLIGLTKTVAREVAKRGITVNAIAPGFIDTPILQSIPSETLPHYVALVPLKRLGTPEEVAGLALLLASEDGGYMVGQTLSPNGGLWM